MESFQSRWLVLAVVMVAMVVAPVRGQISTPCNASIINSFTPCMNYLTNSSAGGSSMPTTQCCDSLKTLTTGGMGCLCLIVTGSVPFQLPINRTLAISLPRACGMQRVPVQCKATASPLPAPGPASLGPSASPASGPSGFSNPSPSPQASSIPPSSQLTPSEAPESDTTSQSPSVDNTNTPPSSTTSSRSNNTPSSSAISSSTFSPSFLLIASALTALLNYY